MGCFKGLDPYFKVVLSNKDFRLKKIIKEEESDEYRKLSEFFRIIGKYLSDDEIGKGELLSYIWCF